MKDSEYLKFQYLYLKEEVRKCPCGEEIVLLWIKYNAKSFRRKYD